MIGFATIFLALLMSVVASYYYFHGMRTDYAGKNGGLARACLWYKSGAGFIGIAASYLLYIIMTNQFEYAYVASYSSRELALVYKLSAFWAGQEGSFMLWVVFHAAIGLCLIRRSGDSPGVMAVYSVLQVILLVLLLIKSPFMMLAESVGDGRGLNPLLQDPWMVIHPPVVFLGYAGLAVPFAYALDSLMTQKHDMWINRVLPWALVAWSALGVGIFVGGFWAYKVLGWGGYWAWDPVENASLVPWLAAGALVHILLLARMRPAGGKLAYVGAIVSFVLVLYGTFLTRSGILSDFSTHSFADEGVGGLLLAVTVGVLLLSLIVLLIRWPDLPTGEFYGKYASREFILIATAGVFTMLAFLVFVGMSTPIFSLLLGKAQSVGAEFYNTTALPIAVLLSILLTMGPVVTWNGNSTGLVRKYGWLAGIALVASAFTVYMGLRQPLLVLIISFSVAACVINLRGAARKTLMWPSGITHVGVAVLLIGIMASSAAGRSETVSFNPQEKKEVLGFPITYVGLEQAADNKGFYHSFLVGERQSAVKPYTKLNKEGRDAAREPGIWRGLWADLYLAPVHQHEPDNNQQVILGKGEKVTQGGLEIEFVRFDGMAGRGGNEEIRIRTIVVVRKDGQKEDIMPEMIVKNGTGQGMAVKVFNQYELTLDGVNLKEGMVRFDVRNLQTLTKSEKIEVDISQKPLINLVWLGTALISLGTLWSGLVRRRLVMQGTGTMDSPNAKTM